MCAKQKNDNKDSELGNRYRTLIALSYCIELKIGEKVIIEKYGDISLFTHSKNVQIEVKHHISPKSLGDGDEDLWKTLYNWHDKDTTVFHELILHTTSHLPQKTFLKYWDAPNTDVDIKHFTLKNGCKSTSKPFKEYHPKIFDDSTHPEEKRKKTFSKITFRTKQLNFSQKIHELKDHPFFSWVKGNKFKESVINKLIGDIDALNIPGKDWEITRDIFDQIVQGVHHTYSTSPYSIILDGYYTKKPSEIQKKTYYNKAFVKSLKDINCDNEDIEDAIVDYWRFGLSYIDLLDTHPSFDKETFQPYKNEIILKDTLSRNKRLEVKTNPSKSKKILSLIFFKNSITKDPIDYNLLRPNTGYFQRGTMHDLIEDGIFDWKVD